MTEFIFDRLLVFDKTSNSNTPKLYTDVIVAWEFLEEEYDDEFMHPSRMKLKVYRQKDARKRSVVLPSKCSLFALNGVAFVFAYFPNVNRERNMTVADEGEIIRETKDVVNACFTIRSPYDFMKLNDLEADDLIEHYCRLYKIQRKTKRV